MTFRYLIFFDLFFCVFRQKTQPFLEFWLVSPLRWPVDPLQLSCFAPWLKPLVTPLPTPVRCVYGRIRRMRLPVAVKHPYSTAPQKRLLIVQQPLWALHGQAPRLLPSLITAPSLCRYLLLFPCRSFATVCHLSVYFSNAGYFFASVSVIATSPWFPIAISFFSNNSQNFSPSLKELFLSKVEKDYYLSEGTTFWKLLGFGFMSVIIAQKMFFSFDVSKPFSFSVQLLWRCFVFFIESHVAYANPSRVSQWSPGYVQHFQITN